VTAFGETIAKYRLREGLLETIDAYLTEPPDEAADPPLRPGVIPEDYFDDRVIGDTPVDKEAQFVDLAHPDTHAALNQSLPNLLQAFEIEGFDRGVVLGQDRRITRPIARHYYQLAQTPDHESIAGLRYESRLVEGWECWAIWEPSPLRTSQAGPLRPVAYDDPALAEAARLLSVALP
jgi:hypothetical protein